MYQVSVEVYHDTYRIVNQERYTARVSMTSIVDQGPSQDWNIRCEHIIYIHC